MEDGVNFCGLLRIFRLYENNSFLTFMATFSQIRSGQLHKSLTFSWLRVESETWCSTKTSASFASFPIQIGRPIMPPYPPPPSLEGLVQCSLMVKISSSFGSTTLGCNPFTMTSHPFRKYRVNLKKKIDYLIIINQVFLLGNQIKPISNRFSSIDG